MNLSIITPSQTITHQQVQNITIPTESGDKELITEEGTSEIISKGTATILIQRKGSSHPEKLEISLENGLAYIRHSHINIVTAQANEQK